MTKFMGKEERSSPKEESEAQKEEFQIEAFRHTLENLKLKLHNLNPGNLSYGGRTESWGPSRYLIGNDDRDETDSETYSLQSYTDGDDDTPLFIKCPFCECDINVSALRHHLEVVNAYDPKNMVCPYCEKNLGEEAIRAMQNSVPRKPTWKYSSSSSGYSTMLDKKLAAFGKRNESMFDPRPCDLQARFSDFQSDEDTISTASDISIARSIGTDAVDSGDEQDRQEKRLRASFAQELVISTLFSE